VIIDYPCQFERDYSVFDLIFETPYLKNNIATSNLPF